MKRPQPDIGDKLREEFLANIGTIKKLYRYWGTEIADGGVEVMKVRQYYYPSSWRSEYFEKLFRMLGAYEDVTTGSYKGVKSAWVYFNKNKEDATFAEETTAEFVSNNLNMMWWDPVDGVRPDGLTLTTTVVIEALQEDPYSDSYIPSTTLLLDPRWATSTLITEISNNYEELWNSCSISQQGVGVINKGSLTDPVTKIVTPDEDDLSPDDPWLQTIARYALRDNGVPCTIKDVEIGQGTTDNGRLYPTYVVTLEIPYIEFTPSSGVVSSIVVDLTTTDTSNNRTRLSYTNEYYTRQAIRSMSSSDLEDDPDLITRPYLFWEEEAVGSFENLWYSWGGTSYIRDGKTYTIGGNTALRADVLANPRSYGLTYKQLNNYLLPLIDSGYKKEKVKWYKKVLAVIIFVVAIILAPGSGGTSLKGAVILAGKILFATLVLNLLSAAFGALGMTSWATAFADVSRMMEPLALVATIVLAWTGITNAVAAAKKAAADAVGKLVGDVTVGEILTQLVGNFADNMISEIVQGATDLASGTLSSASRELLTKLMGLVGKIQVQRLERIQDRNRDLQSEYEKLEDEISQENDVLKGFASIVASPATADWSMYAGLYDTPYERGGGNLHIGNIQKTTKQALRKARYDDPVFANILMI